MDTREEQKGRGSECGPLFCGAGVFLILGSLSLWFVSNPAGLRALRYVGWLIWALGVALMIMSIFVLRSKGKPQKGKDWAHTTVLVDKGIYAVVRHPLYLGWLLMYVAVALFSQHWLTVLAAIPGIACVYLISRREDRRLFEKFGDAYTRYLQSVPAMNIMLGIVRWVQNRGR